MKKQSIILLSLLGVLATSSEGLCQRVGPLAYYESAALDSYSGHGWGGRRDRRIGYGFGHGGKFGVSGFPALNAYLGRAQARDIKQESFSERIDVDTERRQKRAEEILAELFPSERMAVEIEMRRIYGFSKSFPSAKFYKKVDIDGAMLMVPKNRMRFKDAYEDFCARVSKEDFGYVTMALKMDKPMSPEDRDRFVYSLQNVEVNFSAEGHEIRGENMHRADIDALYAVLLGLRLDKDMYLVRIDRHGMLPTGFVEKMQQAIKEKR